MISIIFSQLIGAFAMAASPLQEATVLPLPVRTIVFFGDSLTAGYGVKPEEAYPALVETEIKIAADKKRVTIKVVNAGVSGDTTASGLRRLDWILKQKPTDVIIALGANDMLRGISVTETEKNLNAVVDKILAAGARPILFGMKATPNLGRTYVTQFDGIFNKIAREKKLKYLPFFISSVAAQIEFNQSDRVHPNPQGHKRIASDVTKFLLPLLGLQ